MQMIRQYDSRIYFKWVFAFYLGQSRFQNIDTINQQAISSTLGQIDREKPSCSRMLKSAILGHD